MATPAAKPAGQSATVLINLVIAILGVLEMFGVLPVGSSEPNTAVGATATAVSGTNLLLRVLKTARPITMKLK